jgi:LmbE family N-acetylglucosaminyl deacetylase
MSKPVALAIVAHPDDIEFMMAGTLALLGEAGYELHLMNVANGNGGSTTQGPEEIAARRLAEARAAAEILGATHHPPLCDDLLVFYNEPLLRRLAALVRRLRPRILLTHPPQDYMEDHMNTCRLALTAAFARGVPNFITEPPVASIGDPVTVYHAMPIGLQKPTGEACHVTHWVNIESTLERKRRALAAHESQKEWLDQSQGLDSYLDTMVQMSQDMGALSGRFPCAEGFTKHLHLGYCGPNDDPLKEALGDRVGMV